MRQSNTLLLRALAAAVTAGAAAAQIGTTYCTANVNSTGSIAAISASGSTDVVLNGLTLECASLPPGSFGFFLVSATQGFVMNPGGSSGNICLSGAIGRYALNILNSGPGGQVSLQVDLTNMPHPTMPFAVMGGDVLNFQYWHRDQVSGQPPTSNFSEGLEITFTSSAPAPTFAADVYTLFTTVNGAGVSCLSCHGGTCNIDFSTVATAYATLVNVPSNCCFPAVPYVVPGNSQGSLLYLKLTNPPCGSPMPLIGSFPGDPNVIRDWIDAGALNN